MFRNREEAGRLLGQRLQGRLLHDPLVLAIPRGGVVTGAAIARELGAELDVVLSRKLRAPYQPELAVGAVAEDGRLYLAPDADVVAGMTGAYLADERRFQLGEIARRRMLIRSVRPAARIKGRSVILADDGIATGATMIAALDVARAQGARQVIVAVPVVPWDRLVEIRRHCDELVCLLTPRRFGAIGQFYQNFLPVEDDEVLELLGSPGRPTRQSRETRPRNVLTLQAVPEY